MLKKRIVNKYIAILLVALGLSGCETMGLSHSMVNFPVDIISEPSGAVVEINDNYIGKTPLTVELSGWEATRTFARSHTIVAHPVAPGGETQVKTFSGWYQPDVSYGDIIPTKIYFNMDLIRIPEKLDIDINN